jgi:hypothetical protein
VVKKYKILLTLFIRVPTCPIRRLWRTLVTENSSGINVVTRHAGVR